MKIVFIGTIAKSVFGFRGPLIKSLVEKGHLVYAFAIDYSVEDKETLLKMGVVACDYKLSRSGLNPFADLKMMIYLRRELQAINPDIVFSYFVKPVIFGTLAAKLAKVPMRIAMLEGLGFVFTKQPEGYSLKTSILRFVQVVLYHISLRFATKLIFLNSDDCKELIENHKIRANKVEVLGGIGVDLNEFVYKKPEIETFSFLFIGRLLKEKGIYEFLAAAGIVKNLFPHVKFIVLGASDNTSPNALSTEVLNDLISKGIIEYPGEVSDVYNWIDKSTVFVLPSYREGAPRSTQEAMAIGRPIITTDVPGCRDTVINGLNGFIVKPFSINDLVDKMIWFINNRDKIEKMGLESRLIAEKKFDVNKVNSRIFEMMELLELN